MTIAQLRELITKLEAENIPTDTAIEARNEAGDFDFVRPWNVVVTAGGKPQFKLRIDPSLEQTNG